MVNFPLKHIILYFFVIYHVLWSEQRAIDKIFTAVQYSTVHWLQEKKPYFEPPLVSFRSAACTLPVCKYPKTAS